MRRADIQEAFKTIEDIKSQFYTIDEVANLLKVHRMTVTRWVDDGKIEYIRIGRQYRILRDDLLDFINSNKKNKKKED